MSEWRLATRSLGPEDGFPTAALLAFVLGIGGYLALTQRLFVDGDTGWHLGAGRAILATWSVPRTDPFSYTFAGHAWHAHEWLAEAVMAGVFNFAGWRGVALLFALAGGITAWLIGRELMRWLPVRWALCATFVVGAMLHPLALARPHMLAWPLLAAWVLSMLHARERGQAPQPAALLLMLIWANLHASYMLGLGIAAALTIEALLERPRVRRTMIGWWTFMIGAVLAAFITPHGVQGFLYPFQVSGMGVVAVIDEWRATNFSDDRLFIIVATALWLLVALRWRRIHPLRIVQLAGLSAMAVAHARHQMPLATVAPLLVAPLIARERKEVQCDQVPLSRSMWLAGGVSSVMLIAIRTIAPFTLNDNIAFASTAIARVPAPLRTQAVFNGYSFGGPLILAGIRPYIDGRADMYGDAFTLDYVAMLRGDMARFRRADRRWRFSWTILPPKVGLVAGLDRAPEWRRLYADRWAVIHVRRPDM